MSSIDVVIPCYRYGRYLRECVESVLTQGIDDLRVLIIDDESPDETPEVGAALARTDARVTYRRHAVNQGHIATYNEGIEWAASNYMLLLSADDYLLPGALKRAISLLDLHPEMGFCFGDAVVLTDRGTSTRMRVDLYRAAAERVVVMSGVEFIGLCERQGATNFHIVPTPTAVVRTSLQKRVGGYNAALPHCGDLEMWLRLAAHAAVGYLRFEQAVYRRHEGNMSLAYAQDNILHDLHQRKAAIDAFRDACQGQLVDIRELHARLLRALGREAIGQASTAFNNNKMNLSHRICEFALSVDPGAWKTFAWNRLLLKRRLGFRIASRLLPAVSLIRRVAIRLRG